VINVIMGKSSEDTGIYGHDLPVMLSGPDEIVRPGNCGQRQV